MFLAKPHPREEAGVEGEGVRIVGWILRLEPRARADPSSFLGI